MSRQPLNTGPITQPRLLLGTAQLGMAYGATNTRGRPDDAFASEILGAAVDSGVTHLDTARVYGDSEERIGRFRMTNPGTVRGVVTKIRPLTDGQGGLEARKSLDVSLGALRVSRLTAAITHRFVDWIRPGVADTLQAAVEGGELKSTGASISTPQELEALMADPRCSYVQLPFNLLDRRWSTTETMRLFAARSDVTITVRSVFLQGLLSSEHNGWPDVPGVNQDEIGSALDQLVCELGRRSRGDLCIAYVLAFDWVTSIVVGAETVEQVQDLASLVRCAPLTAREIARVHHVLPPGPAALVDPSRWSPG